MRAIFKKVKNQVNLCKVHESITSDNIMEHLEKHKLVTESQHGFVIYPIG